MCRNKETLKKNINTSFGYQRLPSWPAGRIRLWNGFVSRI